ncbi:ABC-2 type transport system permease protein [Saccharothrix carnea]|uniref:ABC-2 type transport system permease protein n=1 Tax=Saccharothrix carnea TaxID=1280637 RepID=A0A2P8I5U3_SACCR|nr:ABC transporter permease [Saccharothrix carnea]PSL53845.1 ABC-2 type transport system permease protein [Saccharothrix carnea]
MIVALGVAELKLLLRNRTAAALAVLMPLATGLFFALQMDGEEGGWTMVVTLQLLFSFGFTVYVTVTTALTARRQDLYLKRLRTGAASDVVVLTGILLPVVLLGVVQALVLLGISVAAGAPVPARPDLLALALVGGVALSCAAGVATSGVTGTAELAQITTAPFFFALIIGGLFGSDGVVDLPVFLVPGTGLGSLVGAAWGGPTDQIGPAALSVALWAIAATALAGRFFRWDPRG